MLERSRTLAIIPYKNDGSTPHADIPCDGYGKKLLCHLVVALVISAGTTSGTINTDPAINPLGLLNKTTLELDGNPRNYKIEAPASLWFVNSVRFQDQIPKQQPLTSGAAGTYSFGADFIIPLCALGSQLEDQTLTPLVDRSTATLTVTWPGTDVAAAATIVTGSDRTFNFSGTGLVVTVVDMVADAASAPEAPWASIEYVYDNWPVTNSGAGQDHIYQNVPSGAGLRSDTQVATNNNAKSDLLLGHDDFWFGTNPVKSPTWTELVADNQREYGIRQGDWFPGTAIIDFDAAGDFQKIQLSANNNRPKSVFEVLLSPTAPAAVSSLLELVKFNSAGMQKYISWLKQTSTKAA